MVTDLLDDDELLDLRSRARRTDPRAVTEEERSRHHGLPAANDELEAWVHDGAAQPATTAPAEDGSVCHRCHERAGKHACQRCRHRFCSGDYWIMFGLCRDCAADDRVERWHAEAKPEEHNWLEDP